MATVHCRDCNTRTRSATGRCYDCREFPVERSLPKGQWVGGMVKRFVPDKPILPPWIPAPTLGVTCECGCLLRTKRDTCPACLVWAELDTNRASWLLLERKAA